MRSQFSNDGPQVTRCIEHVGPTYNPGSEIDLQAYNGPIVPTNLQRLRFCHICYHTPYCNFSPEELRLNFIAARDGGPDESHVTDNLGDDGTLSVGLYRLQDYTPRRRIPFKEPKDIIPLYELSKEMRRKMTTEKEDCLFSAFVAGVEVGRAGALLEISEYDIFAVAKSESTSALVQKFEEKMEQKCTVIKERLTQEYSKKLQIENPAWTPETALQQIVTDPVFRNGFMRKMQERLNVDFQIIKAENENLKAELDLFKKIVQGSSIEATAKTKAEAMKGEGRSDSNEDSTEPKKGGFSCQN